MMEAAEREARAELAAAFRLSVRFGFHEAIDNHFSYALDGADPLFILNPFGPHWSELRASDLQTVDIEGNVVRGKGPPETSAFCIHSRIHLAQPGARCVLHTHMPYATALTLLKDPVLEPLSQCSLMFYGDVAYDEEYNGIVDTKEEGDRIAAVLGDKKVLLMANHGVIVVGESVAEAFHRLYFLERACQAQVLATSTGRPLKPVGHNRAASTREEYRGEWDERANAHFAALKRVLDRDEPDYLH